MAHATPLVQRAPDSDSTENTQACPHYCAGTNKNQSLIHDYVCGDPRLGPKKLPTHLPLSTLLNTYDRFGGLCPGQFLSKWYNATSGSFIYPPQNGFQLNTAALPISGVIKFSLGFHLDRFGSEYGTFVSPAGAPYMQRALPPSNLDTPASDPRYPYNYHVYKVVKEFDALSGPIAAWFDQPGQGVQYQLSQNILGLLNGNFIERVNLKDF
ncbi:hypothetical protein LSUE1_G000450 [Lachnellula suecica]|uniref:TNT domain-containing protein n=1 Tax=Lachnellula suecica TaxID=602035 RepID=A0A8T9CF18_9HELO|nr:hypothetical protein LSUE1_G000450 [Lachnellula suecica]